jgi:hypothetical protein
MSAAGETVDERDEHRQWGARLNNATWTRLDAGEVDADSPDRDREDLLYGAYAATFHWMQVGTPVHQARGEHLIARTALRVDRPDLALAHATRCLELLEAHPELVEDWDLAFAHEALARAHAATGDLETGRRYREKAVELTAEIADPEEKAVVVAELGRGEWFGLD